MLSTDSSLERVVGDRKVGRAVIYDPQLGAEEFVHYTVDGSIKLPRLFRVNYTVTTTKGLASLNSK
jgi:hypothetical protein